MNRGMNGHGNSTYNSFSNGNMGPKAECMADWYAGFTDDRVLQHWWCMS